MKPHSNAIKAELKFGLGAFLPGDAVLKLSLCPLVK